jgi:hypothetical protein
LRPLSQSTSQVMATAQRAPPGQGTGFSTMMPSMLADMFCGTVTPVKLTDARE